MADLLTHGCTAILVKACTRRADRVAVFVAGTCLPDVLGRVPPMALTRLRWDQPAIPEWLVYVWGPLHMPIGVVATAYAFSFLFASPGRKVIFRNLLGGGLLHIAVDLLQFHFGVGYLLLFPLSMWDFELGWIGSEATVRVVPLLVPVTAVIARWRWGRGPNSATPSQTDA